VQGKKSPLTLYRQWRGIGKSAHKAHHLTCCKGMLSSSWLLEKLYFVCIVRCTERGYKIGSSRTITLVLANRLAICESRSKILKNCFRYYTIEALMGKQAHAYIYRDTQPHSSTSSTKWQEHPGKCMPWNTHHDNDKT